MAGCGGSVDRSESPLSIPTLKSESRRSICALQQTAVDPKETFPGTVTEVLNRFACSAGWVAADGIMHPFTLLVGDVIADVKARLTAADLG